MLMALVVMLYTLTLPIMAFRREHPRRIDLAPAKILLRWTLIGWIAPFLWASLTHAESAFG